MSRRTRHKKHRTRRHKRSQRRHTRRRGYLLAGGSGLSTGNAGSALSGLVASLGGPK